MYWYLFWYVCRARLLSCTLQPIVVVQAQSRAGWLAQECSACLASGAATSLSCGHLCAVRPPCSDTKVSSGVSTRPVRVQTSIDQYLLGWQRDFKQAGRQGRATRASPAKFCRTYTCCSKSRPSQRATLQCDNCSRSHLSQVGLTLKGLRTSMCTASPCCDSAERVLPKLRLEVCNIFRSAGNKHCVDFASVLWFPTAEQQL